MKQMLEENKLDEDDPVSTVRVTDKEIEQRLAKLKDIDPSELKTQLYHHHSHHSRVNFAHELHVHLNVSVSRMLNKLSSIIHVGTQCVLRALYTVAVLHFFGTLAKTTLPCLQVSHFLVRHRVCRIVGLIQTEVTLKACTPSFHAFHQ